MTFHLFAPNIFVPIKYICTICFITSEKKLVQLKILVLQNKYESQLSEDFP